MIKFITQGWLVLLLALLFGSALAVIQDKLGPMIEQNKVKARQDAAVEVVPGGASAEEIEVELTGGKKATVYRVSNADGKLAGWSISAATQGYADKVELIVGLTADRQRVTDFKVIYSQETPGLGDKIKDAEFHRSFTDNLGGKIGRPATVKLTAAKGKNLESINDNEIAAITGATISSQAVCTAIFDSFVTSGLADAIEKIASN